MKIKICVVSGSRAEYGILYPLLKEIKSRGEWELQIVATGMHLSPEFGLTYREIEKDGFRINDKVEMLFSSDTDTGIAKSIGAGIMGLADSFKVLKPDLLIILGDRFEIFSAAIAAFTAKIPIAHLHGGELTEGVIDDAIRHSITKMSFLHFVSTQEYRKRVIRLGESPGRVFNVGALAIDNILNTRLVVRKELEKELGFLVPKVSSYMVFKFGKKNLLVTFHPATLENNSAEKQFKELTLALDLFEDCKCIFTKSNADSNGRIINKLIDEYVVRNPGRTKAFVSLGRLRYLSVLRLVDAVLGNSSSGIIEAPSFGKPTVNVGDRQKGRIRSESVIDCAPETKAIAAALKKALSGEFQALCKKVKNPYGKGNTAKNIYRIISSKIKGIKNVKKRFYDSGE